MNKKRCWLGIHFGGYLVYLCAIVFLIRACLHPKTAFFWPIRSQKPPFYGGYQKTLPARYTFWGVFSICMCNCFFDSDMFSHPKLHFGSNTDQKTAILGGYNARIKKRCRLGILLGSSFLQTLPCLRRQPT